MDAFDNVGETCVSSYWGKTRKEGLITKLTPIDDNLDPSLSEVTLSELKAFFDANGHHPSEEMWTALTELASVLEDMAEGRCPPKMFLSSLDPGVGKTQTVIRFVEALMRSEAHKDVGVLICLSRLKEIDTIVSYYEALARLAVDRRPAQGAIDDAVEKDIMIGEHRHLVLRALCRGNVRRCQGAECAPCNAYIIASVGSGIRKALPQIFPDCQIVSWQPVQKKPLSGKVKEAAEFVIDWLKKTPDGLLRFSVVQKAIGMQPRDFRRNVRRHSDFEEALASQGITETIIGRGGFVKLDLDEAGP